MDPLLSQYACMPESSPEPAIDFDADVACSSNDHSYYLSIGSMVEVDEEVGSMVQILENSLESSSVEIDNHHTGPIPVDYICDRRRRQKTYSKRIKTFLQQARNLHQMCGAEVRVLIKSEAGNEKRLNLPAITTRSVNVQAGESCLTKKTPSRTRKVRVPAGNTPKKLTPKPLKENITNLPGKRVTGDLRKHVHKCFVCKILEKSNQDKIFKKKHGLTKGAFLSCTAAGCSTWVHVLCAGVAVEFRRDLATLKYICEKH